MHQPFLHKKPKKGCELINADRKRERDEEMVSCKDDDTTKPDTYMSISEKFMQGEISEDEFVERYNRLVEQEAEKHWEPVEPHEHI